MENELTCCVCLDLYTEPLMLPCSHNFCKKCLWDLFHHSQLNHERQRLRQITCPKCRREVQVDPWTVTGIDNLPHNKALDNIVRVYKATFRSESKSNSRKCISHVKPLSLYCQTCKRALCEDCVLQSHTGFGHCVKELDDFIQEEKDNARESLQEIETIKTTVVERETEVTTLIVNSKAREMQLRKIVDDQLEMIKHCVSTQQSKIVDDVSAQMTANRVPLEKLAATCSTLRSDIRVLRNSHKDALQETNPERQLKLLQGLTLRLSTFLTFRSSNLPSLPTSTPEQDGHLENVEQVLSALRQLCWNNTTNQRGDGKVQMSSNSTQTESQTIHQPNCVAQNSTTPVEVPSSDKQFIQKDPSPVSDDDTLTGVLESGSRELRQLTGASEYPQQETTIKEVVKKLHLLQLQHKAQTINQRKATNNGVMEEQEQASGNNLEGFSNSVHSDGSSGSTLNTCDNLVSMGATGVSSTQSCIVNTRHCNVSSGSQDKAAQHHNAPQFSFNGRSVEAHRRNTEVGMLSQNGNALEDEESCRFGCTPEFRFRKSVSTASEGAEGNHSARRQPSVGDSAVSKTDILKLYFGHAASQGGSSVSTEVPISSSAAETPPLYSNATQASASEPRVRLSDEQRKCNEPLSISGSPGCFQADSGTGRLEAADSPSAPVFVGPSAEVASSQCCGVGARPKVRSAVSKPGECSRKVSHGIVCANDPRDDRKMGASLKEGLNSAVCTIKSLCRAGFSTGHNRDESLDVNANDNGIISAASHMRSFEGQDLQKIRDRELVRNASVPVPVVAQGTADSVAVKSRSVGTSPVNFVDGQQERQGSVWTNFSFNDVASTQAGASKGAALSGLGSTSTHLLPVSATQPWDRSQSSNGVILQSELPTEPARPSPGATLTSLSQLPKWDQTCVAQTLSKIDLSEFWSPSAKSSNVKPPGSQGGTFVFGRGASLPENSTEDKRRRDDQSDQSTSSSSLAFSLPDRLLDFVGPAPPSNRQISFGSPKFKQRRYQKSRKRNQQSK